MKIEKKKSRKGFASLSPERLRELSSKGGRSVPAEKRTFSVDRKKAIAAGVKGRAGRKKALPSERVKK